MARLLYLVHRIPYPPTKGDKIRSFNILKALAAKHEVVLGTFVDDKDDLAHAEHLQQWCNAPFLQPIQPSLRKALSVHGLATGEPLSVAFYRDAAFSQWVSAQIEHGVDAIVLFSSAMARFVPESAFQSVPVWMDFVDLDSDKWAQYARGRSGIMRWVYRREAEKLFAYEERIAERAHMSSFVTDAETALFIQRSRQAEPRVCSVHNGVNAGYFAPQPTVQQVADIVFTGAMDYGANVDAVCWFAQEVFPKIQAEKPGARFTIVGAKPAKAVSALANRAGIEVTGWVEDTRPYMARAGVCIAPMRIARGVQNKVLEAMAMGKAVVATTAGYEGIKAIPGEHLLLADTPGDFATSVLSLLNDQDQAERMGAEARKTVKTDYSWQAALEPMTQFADTVGNGMF